MKKWLIRAVAAGAVCGLVLAVCIGIGSLLKNSPLFIVQYVEVRGVERTDRDVLKTIYQPLIGKNIFQDIPEGALLTDDPWVSRLEVKRVIPNKLLVIVKEEKELIAYKEGTRCTAVTDSGNKIPVACMGVKVRVQEFPLPEEFNEFVALYNRSSILQESDITLKNGFFTAVNANGTFVGTYTPGVFENNLNIYLSNIRNRYKAVYNVDLTVRGKVYVKGVTNG